MSMRLIATALLIFVVQLGGCAMLTNSVHQDARGAGIVAPKTLIASDFVNVLKQLEELRPDQSTIELQTSERDDSFTLAMHDALRLAGYGIRWVQNNNAPNLFEYQHSSEESAASTSQDFYEVSFGAVDMRRGYLVDAKHRVQPVTSLYIRGADASDIVLNDDIFNDANANHESAETPAEQYAKSNQSARLNAVPASMLTQRPVVPLPTSDTPNITALKVPDEANPLDLSVASVPSSSPLTRQLTNVQRTENVFDLGESNFDMMLSEHAIVAERVLTFANDSMRLGGLNKRLVQQMVERFNPQTDVFSVTGCSMGPTSIKGGNAALALGRAGRVVEALRFNGVEDKHIFDEGCWAGSAKIDSMPARGVVLTLNRQL